MGSLSFTTAMAISASAVAAPSGEPAAADNETAQMRQRTALGIFRNEFLRCGRHAGVGKAPDQQRQVQHIDEHAEFVGAHPARQRDLRAVGQYSADDADEERRARDFLGNTVVAVVGKPRLEGLFWPCGICRQVSVLTFCCLQRIRGVQAPARPMRTCNGVCID